ncbi:hypothetical protein KY386_02240 [Candidatus Parcubacteria bacterium]|nr:hypothetical protein [Candidatus Parcubacteria bacterium]
MGREKVVLSDAQLRKLHLPERQRLEVWVQADRTGDGHVVLPVHSPLYSEYRLYQDRPALGRHTNAFYTIFTLALGLYRHQLNIYREQDQMHAQQLAIEDVRYLLGMWSYLTPDDQVWIEQQRRDVVAALDRVQDPTKREIHGFLADATLRDSLGRLNPSKARTQYTAALKRYPLRDAALERGLQISRTRAWLLGQRMRRYDRAMNRLVRVLALAGRWPEGLAIQEFAVAERILQQDKPGNFLVHVIRRLQRVRPDVLNDPAIARRLEQAVRFEGSLAWFLHPFARLDSYTDDCIMAKRSVILAELMERRKFLELETIDAYEHLIERLQVAVYQTGLKLEAATGEGRATLAGTREVARATLALVRYRLDDDGQPTGEWYMTPEYQLRLGGDSVAAS